MAHARSPLDINQHNVNGNYCTSFSFSLYLARSDPISVMLCNVACFNVWQCGCSSVADHVACLLALRG
jgi:hypothetical protein